MFIYRPHLHQLDGTITPDLIIDAAHLAGEAVPVLLSDQVHVVARPQALAVGWVVFAARYGALLAPAVVLPPDPGSPMALCHVSRQAWRWTDVREHLAELELRAACRDASGAIVSVRCPMRPAPDAPGTGRARCEAARHAPLPAASESITLELHDPVRSRSLTQRLFLRAPLSLAA